MGKGSGARPFAVPFDEYAERRKAIFGEPVRARWIPPPLPCIDKPQQALSALAYDLDKGKPKES